MICKLTALLEYYNLLQNNYFHVMIFAYKIYFTTKVKQIMVKVSLNGESKSILKRREYLTGCKHAHRPGHIYHGFPAFVTSDFYIQTKILWVFNFVMFIN